MREAGMYPEAVIEDKTDRNDARRQFPLPDLKGVECRVGKECGETGK